MEEVFCTIIGGGVIGCAVAYELSKEHNEVFVFERRRFLGEEQSGRNSGVIHAGVYYTPGSLKSRLCVEGNRLLYRFCVENGVAAEAVGKLIVAVDEAELRILKRLQEQAVANGVEGVGLVSGGEARELEPNISCVAALHFPTTGIVDAAGLINTLAKLARMNGVSILTQAEVVGVEPEGDSFKVKVRYGDGREESFSSRWVINAAGLYSDEVYKMVNPTSPLRVVPFRGEYQFYNATSDELELSMNIYPAPPLVKVGDTERFTVGVHLTPTFELTRGGKTVVGRRVLVGPLSRVIERKDDYETGRARPSEFIENIRKFFPSLGVEHLREEYTGIQAKLSDRDDFCIGRDEKYPRFINLIGIDSPGLTSCLSIARLVVRMFADG